MRHYVAEGYRCNVPTIIEGKIDENLPQGLTAIAICMLVTPFSANAVDTSILNGRGYPDTTNPAVLSTTDPLGRSHESQKVVLTYGYVTSKDQGCQDSYIAAVRVYCRVIQTSLI